MGVLPVRCIGDFPNSEASGGETIHACRHRHHVGRVDIDRGGLQCPDFRQDELRSYGHLLHPGNLHLHRVPNLRSSPGVY